MLTVNNISMRFGPRVLFEDVTCTFMAGRRYAVTGPNGAGKSTFMKILTGEIEPTKGSISRPKKMGVLRQDQFAFDQFRVIDTVIMGNASLWKALEERDALYAKPHEELTDADGMRLGELEGIVGEEGGYTAEADAATLLDGLGIESSLHERKMGELQGGQKVRVLLAQALFGTPQRPAARRAHQQPGPRFRALAATLFDRVRRRAHRDFARPPFPQQRLHAHRGHRLRNDHHVRRRLRRHGRRENADSLAHRIGKREPRKENRATQRFHRALFGRYAFRASHFAQKRSRAAADYRTGALEYSAALHQMGHEAKFRETSAGNSRASKNPTTT